jgi:hypothetical protein
MGELYVKSIAPVGPESIYLEVNPLIGLRKVCNQVQVMYVFSHSNGKDSNINFFPKRTLFIANSYFSGIYEPIQGWTSIM